MKCALSRVGAVPDDASSALRALLDARKLGREDALLGANTALAYLLLDDPVSALSECEHAHELGLSQGRSAYLWVLEDLANSFGLAPNLSIALNVCDIAISASQKRELTQGRSQVGRD